MTWEDITEVDGMVTAVGKIAEEVHLFRKKGFGQQHPEKDMKIKEETMICDND